MSFCHTRFHHLLFGIWVWGILMIGTVSCGKHNWIKSADEVKVMGFEDVLTSDTKWKKSKSPYFIHQNTLILEDVTLTIEPGVKVYVSPGVLIMCHGKIEALGKKDSPIYFRAASKTPWNRIECYGGRYEQSGDVPINIFHYCIFEGGGGLTLRSSAGDIKGCIFRNNFSSPLRFEHSSGQITENEIYENMTQRESDSGNGAGIMVYTDKAVLIADNVVHDNFSSGGRDGGGGIYAFSCNTGDVKVIRNSVYGNLSDRNGGGIYAHACHLEENQVRYNSTSDSGGGIYAIRSTLINNRVRQNQAVRGGGIYADNCRLEYNLILENTARSGMGGGLFYMGDNMIVNNTFIKNGARDLRGDTLVVLGNPEIAANNIISEYGYALRNQNPSASIDLNARGNYWGTPVEKNIPELIYDWLDDSEAGLVDYMDYSENWIGMAPDEPYTWAPPQAPAERLPNELHGRIDRNRILGRFGRLSFDVVENVLIPEGITLQILPGTRFYISPKVHIRVRGKLVIQGSPDNMVLLTGDPDAPWGKLFFENIGAQQAQSKESSLADPHVSDETSLLSYCTIENGLGIVMDGAGARMEDCIIRQHYNSGIKIHDAAVTITRCKITDNASPTHGGGIYVSGSKYVRIDANQILNNYAEENGGGIYVFSEHAAIGVVVSDNRIEGNQCQLDGGGIWASKLSLVRNQIFSNAAEGRGGGLFSSFSVIEENHIATNEASQGGGVFGDAEGVYSQNIIEKNRSQGPLAGGVYLNFGDAGTENKLFRQNVVIENSASGDNAVGGVYLLGVMEFSENALLRNKGLQLYNANPFDAGPFNAVNCYWGTQKTDEIASLIFDHKDEPSLSEVVFEPLNPEMIHIHPMP